MDDKFLKNVETATEEIQNQLNVDTIGLISSWLSILSIILALAFLQEASSIFLLKCDNLNKF